MYTHICEFCKKEFKSPEVDQKFCSVECAHKARTTTVVCAECGKEEVVPLCRAKKYVCCSRECLGKYNSKRYSKRAKLICPICGNEYECRQSKIPQHRTCGDPECRRKWLEQTRKGKDNSNYKSVEELIKNNPRKRDLYYHVVKEYFNFPSLTVLKQKLKGYDIHHKNCNPTDNRKENLVILPHSAHMLLHRYFGNILLDALHSNRISLDIFKQICTEDQWSFYKNIYNLDIASQVVVKQGELLESPEEDNQQASIYRNIYEASTTNSRVLPDNAEDSNANTSALPTESGDDIV